MSLSRCQFNTLGVLAREPDNYRIAFSCASGSFGEKDDPTGRRAAVILSIPPEHRWPAWNTIAALERRGFIEREKKTLFWTIYRITLAGLEAHRNDPAFDSAASVMTSDRHGVE